MVFVPVCDSGVIPTVVRILENTCFPLYGRKGRAGGSMKDLKSGGRGYNDTL